MPKRTENISKLDFVGHFLMGLSLFLILSCVGNKPKDEIKLDSAKDSSKVSLIENEEINQPYDWNVKLISTNRIGLLTPTSFRDSSLNISFEIQPNIMAIQIQNISGDSLYIVWNDCFFEFAGKHRVQIMHSQVDFYARHQPLLNEYIYPGATEGRFIAPKPRVDWHRQYKKWRSFPIFDDSYEALPGQQFSFVLFMHDGINILPYSFLFEISDTYPINFINDKTNPYKIKPESVKNINIHPEFNERTTGLPTVPESLKQEPPIIEVDGLPTNIPFQESDSVTDSPQSSELLELNDSVTMSTKTLPAKKSKSQKGITALLDKLSAEKQSQEALERTDVEREQGTSDTSVQSSKNPAIETTTDLIRKKMQEQAYFDSLAKPENIPLFEEDDETEGKDSTKNKKRTEKSGKLKSGITFDPPPEPLKHNSLGGI